MMQTNGTPPVAGTAKANNQTMDNAKQNNQNTTGTTYTQETLHPVKPGDAAIFTIGERDTLTPEQYWSNELKYFLQQVEESNQKLLEAAAKWKPFYPEPCAVPSTLGLSVNAAASKLKYADLKVRRVVQEYNENVPQGHVISQVPGPGGTASKKAGVALVISKGPPPESEKYDTVRKKETVPILRIKSKSELQDMVRAQMRMDGQDPDSMEIIEQDGTIYI